jgi:hypothetical protein
LTLPFEIEYKVLNQTFGLFGVFDEKEFPDGASMKPPVDYCPLEALSFVPIKELT